MKIKLLLLAMTLAGLTVSSCRKEMSSGTDPVDAGEKAAPDGFDYSTTKSVDVTVRLLSRNEKPISGVLVSIYNPGNVSEGAELTKVLSDNNGYVRTTLTVPSVTDTLIIDPAYIGLLRNAKAYISANAISAVIGGENGSSGNIDGSYEAKASASFKVSAVTSSVGPNVIYNTADFDKDGRPLALVTPDDVSGLLDQVTAVLPEKKNSVPAKYLNSQAPANLKITQLADVWISFLHEGADYRNVLGYYTYPTGQDPKTPAEISKINVILLNASYRNSKGGMVSGDKVKIGRFEAGTTIGFVLLQDAYNSDKSVNLNARRFYTNEELNPEENNGKKRHNVLLHNAEKHTFIIGFEDQFREGNSSDNDFNDLVFYAQSNPVEAISPVDIPYLEENVKDTDKDGVPDFTDEYPNDPTRAYDRYYPSKLVWGTTAFEDQWPAEGDYDLNDLVVSYRYKFAINSNNKVVNMDGEFKPLAAGASFQNGFGVQLPLAPGQVSSVTGYKHAGNYIQMASNGTEAGQSKAVLIPFDTYRAAFGASSSYVNTYSDKPKLSSDVFKLEVAFTSVLPDEFTAAAPFNPFMISDLTRGREIHLVNHVPTDLADLKLLKTIADDSDPSKGRYYITATNRPFALDFFGPFIYPVEKKAIQEGYTHFDEWAASGGKQYADWYSDHSGYRTTKNLYTK
ncbi:LruC domain-containing protein [Pararcticibacter amylolyticus]|uniref:LruC domain-containing protein n=1 Tax=Pararcticibacter amylolyticus TaxID=2173175 RepID=A0A2U2PJU3_9SPHI|nr:LruC domain-containing protein [Pararcticibacter amylolyticus]PWG81675.1 hypothetical protein DDR33_04690 [Pararcticibacter amylolyticus]